MLNQRQSLIYGVTGQTVEFYAPESLLGAPSSAATYDVFSLSADLDGDAEFSGTATADSVSTTFDANSGWSQASSRDKCNLTSTANIAVGRLYLATNAFSQRELVKVDAISSGAYVSKEGPLSYDYASGDTFVGLRQYFTIDPTWVATEENIGTDYRVRWAYTIGGIAYRAWTYFDLVRVQVKADIDGRELYELFPDLRHEQYSDLRGGDWNHIRDRAVKRIDFDLQKFGIKLDQMRTSDWNEVLLSLMRMILAESGWSPPGRDRELFVQESRTKYWDDMGNLKNRAPLDQGGSGGATQRGAQQLVFRR